MVALELEVMAKKMERFGWERDRGTAAHDRLIEDWIVALRDYPLDEIQAACHVWVQENPRKMPNEGDVLALVLKRRRAQILQRSPIEPYPEPERERVTPKRKLEILIELGFGDRKKWENALELKRMEPVQ